MTALYPVESAQAIADKLGRGVRAIYMRANLLGLSKPEGWAAECTRKRWAEGRHEGGSRDALKGGRGWNKGIKGSTGTHANCRSTQFKKGELSGRARELLQPIGAERISKDGYVERKVNNDLPLQARWRGVHRIVWESANGPVPPGHAVVFRQGMKTTDVARITPDAVELVSRAELMRRNSYHTRYPKEVAQLIQLRGALNRQINKRIKA